MPRERKLPPGLWRRGRVFFARIRANGREIRQRLSTDFGVACQMLHDLRARADRADFGLLDNNYKFNDLKEQFLAWARQAVRDPDKYKRDLAKFEEFMRIGNVREIDQQLVIGFRAWRLGQQVSPRTVNRQVGTLHNLLNKGVEWKRIGSNPIAGLKPLRHDSPKKRRRSLTVAEVQAIFDASPPNLTPVWRMLMTTGVRRGELVDLRFDDVDFERKLVTIRAESSKNHRAREVPLDDEVLAEITRRREEAKSRRPVLGKTPKQTEQQQRKFSRDHIFVTQANTPLNTNLIKRFYAVCKKAGIEGAKPGGTVDLHALRTSFITLSIEHGGSPKAVQAIVGHSSLAMTMGVYAKATDSAKRDAVGALPFASVTTPQHVLSLQRAHKLRTSRAEPSQDKTA